MESDTGKNIDLIFLKIALNDDEAAFRSLFDFFFPSLCIFAHRFIDSWETCEDIVQETFYKIWKDRKSLKITVSARNFLVTSVRNRCIDYLRRQKMEMEWMRNEKPSVLQDQAEEVYTILELETMLNTALSQLSERVRTVFEKSRFEGKPTPK
jgi:RNA polymerase sigma-70 factor (ECF subfamily)